MENIVNKMSSSTAGGLDGVTFRAGKALGKIYCMYLIKIFNEIFRGGKIPFSWRTGEVCLLQK